MYGKIHKVGFEVGFTPPHIICHIMNMAPVARTPASLPPNMTPASLSPASLAPDVAVSLASLGVVATLWLTP